MNTHTRQNNRNSSQFITMRKFHNRIKYQLITQSILHYKRHNPHQLTSILDVSVGRFGDLYNYIRSGVDYVLGMDPHEESINEAERRLINTDLNADIHIATITNKEKPPSIEQKTFSVVCCHFTLHYFFEKESMLRNALQHISEALVPGGYFIGTTIVGKRVDQCDKESEHYAIRKLYNEEEKKENVFGLGYKFKLVDNPDTGLYFDINKEQTEYLVNVETFVGIAKEYNLKLLKLTDFWQYSYYGKKVFKEWERTISQMNISFVFVKIKKNKNV